MGQVKEYQMDMEFARDALSEFIKILESNIFDDQLAKDNTFKSLSFYRNFISALLQNITISQRVIDIRLLNYINDNILPIYYEISGLHKLGRNDYSHQQVTAIFKKFDAAINEYLVFWSNENLNKNVVNSVAYYNTKIQELKNREADLLNIINKTKNESGEEIQKARSEILQAKATIIKYEKELEIKRKQEDAKENWKANIDETFLELKKYLQPIRSEKIRLNRLFWAYLISSLLAVLLIVFIEIVAVVKVISTVGFPSFKEYLTLYLPLPVAGALLWGFIYQMNRAQRQLIVLAKSIHKVEYIQGLLLSINKLAPTIDDGITRINLALDKLINNYFIEKECNSEEDIIKEEKKDVVPVDSLIKLLREIKGVVNKD